ncbi:MAG: cell division protein FtsW [Candidatus Taylorbacteria bacterium]|nr:cell division protein FtsW [Candidatus Taylorbacteria bacterium]
MSMKSVDRSFLITVAILVIAGFFIFSSASLGVLSKNTGKYQAVTFNQLMLGLVAGSVAAYITSRISYQFWRKHAFYIFVSAFLLMLLVFIPGVGRCAKGACRWIVLGGQSFQPAEFYKLGFVMYLSAWYASVKQKSSTSKFGTIPFVILSVLTASVVLMQPDTDTFMVIIAAGVAIYVTAGGKWKDLAIMGLVGVIGLTALVLQRPYLQQRILTFADPSKDPTGSSYQVQQSLIAIGSGGLTGRGFGQSIQKFNFLPEPIGDSIFAVAAEEFGFVGSVFIIFLYIMFALKGLKIAIRAPDIFGSYLVVGIITLITIQSFLNIAAMLAIIPLSGTPLLFISHGGTALFFALASVGIVLNVSRHQRKV